jgi:hypothetical protein
MWDETKEIERFESWCDQLQIPTGKWPDGEYAGPQTKKFWMVWCAALTYNASNGTVSSKAPPDNGEPTA